MARTRRPQARMSTYIPKLEPKEEPEMEPNEEPEGKLNKGIKKRKASKSEVEEPKASKPEMEEEPKVVRNLPYNCLTKTHSSRDQPVIYIKVIYSHLDACMYR